MFTNQISIGGASPLVPPLPGMIDGPVTGGIAKHGRFEGIGTFFNVVTSPTLYQAMLPLVAKMQPSVIIETSTSCCLIWWVNCDIYSAAWLRKFIALQLLLQLGKFGNDGPDGPSTVFNFDTLVGIKNVNFAEDQAANPDVTYSCRSVDVISENTLCCYSSSNLRLGG